MKLRTKLYVAFGSIIILLVIFSLIVFNMLTLLNRNLQEVVVDNYAQVKYASDIRSGVNTINRVINEMIIGYDRSPEFMQRNIQRAEENLLLLDQDLHELRKMNFTPEADKLFVQIELLVYEYIQHINTVIPLLELNQRTESIEVVYRDADPIRQQLFQLLREFNMLQEEEMAAGLEVSNSTYQWSGRLIVTVVLIVLIIGIAVATWVLRSLTRSLKRVTDVMDEIANKEVGQFPRIHVISNDEIGQISKAYNEMAASLEKHREQENAYKSVLQKQNWQKTKIADLTAKYHGIQDLEALAGLFISEIAHTVGAGFGAFYIRQEQEYKPTLMVQAASYAGGMKEGDAHEFALGEGLVGQCALENKMIVINDPPANYFQIGSGLGSAKPTQIMFLPVQFEYKVVAVVELASFQAFTEQQLSLLEELLPTLGITINSISIHMQVQKLLKESQVFTEELQTQSEEMQMQQEELRALNEQLESQFKDTEQRNQELERIRSELEKKNEQILLASSYKSEFLANMSHELRTPLNSLLILSQLLATNPEGNLTEKQVEFINTIHSSGSDLLSLINEVLDLAKVESGNVELVYDSFSVKDLSTLAKNQFQPIALQKGITYEVIVEPDLMNRFIYSDEQKVQQVLKNLLSNAFKFTEQGSVTLQLRTVRADEREASPWLSRTDEMFAIVVSDTGIGIPEDKQQIIFDAFKQVDGTTSRKYGGTGLGLSITDKLVSLLGGVIEVQSSSGKGSIFTVYLPLNYPQLLLAREAAVGMNTAGFTAESSATIPSQQEKTESQLKDKKILLVDDDLRNIYALSSVLDAYQVNLIYAENGIEGLEMLKQHPDTDLVLMDIMMPKMDGYEAMREIRKMEQFESLPIIALTAKAMKQDRELCLEAGASDYISKPINMEQLLSLIHVWMHG